jgi:lipid-A-disaccharide synthase
MPSNSAKKIFLICGESSGDQHAADVIKAAKNIQPDTSFCGMGGDKCIAAGMQVLIHQKEMAFMGFYEVVKNLRTIRRKMTAIKNHIIQTKPDAILLIDYAGFNLRIAKFAKNLQIPVHFYIAPKTWAWNEGRNKKIQQYVDYLYCILPFEPAYFQRFNINAQYVGNPSIEQVKAFQPDTNFLDKYKINKPIIALLPGSRKQEIESSLPIMIKMKKHFPEYELVVAQAPGYDDYFYYKFDQKLKLIKEDMYNLLHHSKAAIVTSGTATLETALHRVPQVVCYKTSTISYTIAKRLVKLKYISLVNLIMNKPVVTELIQQDFSEENVLRELRLLLKDQVKYQDIQTDYDQLMDMLGKIKPSEKVAKFML